MNYAVILAGGKGTRMKTELPKCAYPLLRIPMLEYSIRATQGGAIDQPIVIVGYKREIIEEIVGERAICAYQEEQKGTGHAVAQALPFLEDKTGNTVVLCGDMPMIKREVIDELLTVHLKENNDITVISTIMENPTNYGRIIRSKDGMLTAIVEEKDSNEDIRKIREINTGVYCVKTALLGDLLAKVDNKNARGEYYLTDIAFIGNEIGMKVWVHCIKENKFFTGVNDLYALSIVESQMRMEINRDFMLSGVAIINPDTVTIGSEVIIKPGAVIHPNTYITGNTIIEAKCVIGPNTEIHESMIGEGSIVKHSLVHDSVIGKHNTVGPFAHLRNHAKIGDDLRIGNFVEIKNSTIGNETKIAHLSYVGDTECGENVNFGCGCVTVNYDGVNKHKTVIGDHVFIGCNSNLIAPINIANGVYIAAGSTLYENVPADALAIARAKQVNKEDYAKKYKAKKE